MTYSESAEGLRVTRQRALQELVRHGRTLESLDGFERDEFEGLFNADRKCNASQLLEWLGY
jgi:hypothetical protein